MNQHAALFGALFRKQPVASLGTLHEGNPAVSMVPYAVLPDLGAFIIHVSRLSGHTADMRMHPQVGLMVMAAPDPAETPQALPRVSFQCVAAPISKDDGEYARAKGAYLQRFPESEPMFSFGDFSLFQLVAQRARVVAGFAQAATLSGDALRAAFVES